MQGKREEFILLANLRFPLKKLKKLFIPGGAAGGAGM
jgi:hypothetical protein